MTLAGLALLALSLPVLALAAVRPRLVVVLAELCGARFRGDFWVAVSTLGLLAGPGVSALGMVAVAPRDDFGIGVALLRGSAGGLLLGLVAVAVVVLFFTGRLAQGLVPPAPDTP
jgi:hypothetical protein